jgi:hypothetical protein
MLDRFIDERVELLIAKSGDPVACRNGADIGVGGPRRRRIRELLVEELVINACACRKRDQ